MKKYGAWKYIRQFKGSSIFIRNFLTIICAVMIPVAAAGVIIYNEYNGYIEKSITESKLNEAGSISETVNLVIMEAERMAYRVANENTFDSFRKTQEDIVFEICDNGVGISQKKCDEINSETGAGDEHIGLRNVNERIKIMFGMKYGLFIAPRGGGGTVVTMHIPIIE